MHIHRAHSEEGFMDTFTSYYKQFIILFVKTNKTNQLQIAVFDERQDQGGLHLYSGSMHSVDKHYNKAGFNRALNNKRGVLKG